MDTTKYFQKYCHIWTIFQGELVRSRNNFGIGVNTKKYFNMAVFGPPVKFTFAPLLLSIKLQVKVKAAAVLVVELDNSGV